MSCRLWVPPDRIEWILLLIGSMICADARARDVAECKAIGDDAQRLACYDDALDRNAVPPPRPIGRPDANVGGGLVDRDAGAPRLVAKPSALVARWDLDGRTNESLFDIRSYNPVYILPAFYSSSPNLRPTSPNPENDAQLPGPIDHVEGKFQISMKVKLLQNVGFAGSNVWFGYTQLSFWQVYNAARSRPFRETDYQPELMWTAPTYYSLFGVDGRMIGLSLVHQSNGRDLPQSRSWNRVIGQVGLEAGEWTVLVRPWLRIRENVANDDNPDILNYVGRGEVVAARRFGDQQLTVTLRHSLRAGAESHGSVNVDWAFPLHGDLKGYVQFFSGYGESLIDYNHHQNAIGVGISLDQWL